MTRRDISTPANPAPLRPSPFASRPASGFALLITVTLLAFLVLLLVSLASLTRVETQVASNNQSLAQARQNALMALNIAIGQLQKYTGPDQRVTAAADIAAAAAGTALADNSLAQNPSSVNGTLNGLVPASATASVQSGTRWWTGVWGRAGTSYSVPSQSPYTQTPSPVLLNWLVSGNEDRTFTTDATGLVKTSSADGTAAANTATFTPGAPVNWAGGYSNLEIKSSGQKAVLLVGPMTAGVNPDAAGVAAVDRYVVAPLKDITVASSTVPGAGAAGTITVGRYAWWVGDEGVKASYSLADPNPGKITPGGTDTDAATSRLRLMVPSRTGIELIPGFSAYPSADDPNTPIKLVRLLQIPQASLLDSTLTAETLRSHFNDFTPLSSGVLTDTLNGGLRQDLTYYFEPASNAWNSSPLKGQSIIPSTYSPNWSGALGYAPKWDWLYSFYNTNPDATQSTPTLTVRPETPTTVGIAPIITQFRMVAFTDPSKIGPLGNVNNIPAGTYSLPMRCNVAFVLANPYNVTLTAPANTYEFVLQNTYYTNPAYSGLPTDTPSGLVIGASNTGHAYNASYGSAVLLRANGVNADTTSKSILDTVRYTLPAISIPPGGTCVLAVKGNNQIGGGILQPSVGAEDAIALEVKDTGNPVIPPSASTPDYFTSRSTLDFIAPAPVPPATTSRTILLMYLHDQVFITITLRQAGNGPILQQLKDCGFSKTQETTGVENSIIGNLHIKFLPPAFRSMDSSTPAAVFHYALYAYARPYIDLNLRASIEDHTSLDQAGKLWNGPSYAGGVDRTGYQSPSGEFTSNLTPAYWSENFDTTTRSPVASQGVFFDFPRRSSASLPPVLSLGALQHASLTADDWHPGTTINYQPAYAVGNSYSSPFVTRNSTIQSRKGTGSPANWYQAPSGNIRFFDMAYLLNTALWDGYYFSGIPQTGPTLTPLNPRYTIYDGTSASSDLRTSSSASHLLVKGSFNINSTSVAAWSAFLGGLDALHVNNDPATGGTPFPRTLWQPTSNTLTGSSYTSSGTSDDAYSGYRRLNATEITSLATEIVKRVRARGPFVSLSHFINRSLVAASSAFNATINDADSTTGNLASATIPMGRGLSGPLQAALDSTASGINSFQQVSGSIVTPGAAGAYGDRVLFAGEMQSTTVQRPLVVGDSGYNAQPVYFADKLVDLPNLDPVYTNAASPGPQGRTSTGIPGWLLQSDILQALGPALSARSDTFVIRTYGEVVNPTDSTQVQAKAWCEAVVQRLPAYLDSTTGDTSATPPSALSSTTNKTYGRGYKIISFRWLSASDI